MQISWQDIIDRARTYVDDDHNDQKGWIKPEKWLILAQLEYEQHYRRWIRSGLIGPSPTDTTFTGPSTALTRVLAIIDVAEVLATDEYRRIPGLHETAGRRPIRNGYDSPAVGWDATGAGDDLTLQLHPADTQGSYLVRYLRVPERTVNPDATVDLPFGGDERIVLGLARRALVKESARSMAINELIRESDEELAFTAAARMGGLRVRKTASTPRRLFSDDPRFWRFYR